MRILFAGVASAFYGLLAGLLVGFIIASALLIRRIRDWDTEFGKVIGITLLSTVVCTTAFGIAGVRSARRHARPDAQAADYDDRPLPPPG